MKDTPEILIEKTTPEGIENATPTIRNSNFRYRLLTEGFPGCQ